MDSDSGDEDMEFVADDESGEEEEGGTDRAQASGGVYVPGKQELQEGEKLEVDESAYVMYHQAQTGVLYNFCVLIRVYGF